MLYAAVNKPSSGGRCIAFKGLRSRTQPVWLCPGLFMVLRSPVTPDASLGFPAKLEGENSGEIKGLRAELLTCIPLSSPRSLLAKSRQCIDLGVSINKQFIFFLSPSHSLSLPFLPPSLLLSFLPRINQSSEKRRDCAPSHSPGKLELSAGQCEGPSWELSLTSLVSLGRTLIFLSAFQVCSACRLHITVSLFFPLVLCP